MLYQYTCLSLNIYHWFGKYVCNLYNFQNFWHITGKKRLVLGFGAFINRDRGRQEIREREGYDTQQRSLAGIGRRWLSLCDTRSQICYCCWKEGGGNSCFCYYFYHAHSSHPPMGWRFAFFFLIAQVHPVTGSERRGTVHYLASL